MQHIKVKRVEPMSSNIQTVHFLDIQEARNIYLGEQQAYVIVLIFVLAEKKWKLLLLLLLLFVLGPGMTFKGMIRERKCQLASRHMQHAGSYFQA